MNFLEAKNIISPRHAVIPGSNEHKEILNLMRQSGRVFAEDNVPPVSVPLKSRAKFISRPPIPQTTKPVSKRDSAILKMISPPVAQTAQTAPLFWRNKKIASLNITKHGRREKVQVAPEIEGRAGESKESS
jgi:hypothetical protein